MMDCFFFSNYFEKNGTPTEAVPGICFHFLRLCIFEIFEKMFIHVFQNPHYNCLNILHSIIRTWGLQVRVIKQIYTPRQALVKVQATSPEDSHKSRPPRRGTAQLKSTPQASEGGFLFWNAE